jgi:hypothetical protein
MIDRIDERSTAQGYEISRLPKFTDEEIEYIKGTHDFMALILGMGDSLGSV